MVMVQSELVERAPEGAAGAVSGSAGEGGDDGSGLLVERLLREPERIWRQIAAERELGRLNRQLVVASWVPLAVYGAVLGASNSVLQAVASAVKLPVLFLLTLAICLPALYLFNLVFGSRLRLAQTLAIVLTAIATTGVLTLGFAPISVFFLLSAPGYGFFKLLNVAVLAITGATSASRLRARCCRGIRTRSFHCEARSTARSRACAARRPPCSPCTEACPRRAPRGPACSRSSKSCER